jgi:hypothetical protein
MKITKAEHAQHVAIIREGLNAEVERLRESLGEWIKENTHRANDTAISIAMLETAFDSYIELLGESDAFRFDRVGVSAKSGNISAFSAITANPTLDGAAVQA